MIKINESDILSSKDNKDISNKVFNNINEVMNTLTNHDKVIGDLYNKKELFKENIEILNELKEFPLEFTREGDLIIKNLSKLDYQQEYQKSHKLLLSYEKTNALEGMKYEISKLWLLNTELERKIYDPKESKKKRDYTLIRARILNDFNKYLKFINKQEKDFNFIQYYNHTPFSDASIKITGATLFHTGQIIKQTIKGILL